MEYEITLADGTKISRLGMNGDNYISETKVDESVFRNNLSTMVVSDGETEIEYHYVELIQQMEWADGTWYLAFREKTDAELREERQKEENEKMQSNIEYIAMMTDVDLEG